MTSETLKLDNSSELYFNPGIQILFIKKKILLFIGNQNYQRYQVSSQELLRIVHTLFLWKKQCVNNATTFLMSPTVSID